MSKPGVGRILSIAVGIALLVGLWIAAPEIFTGTVSDLDTFLRVAALVVGLGLWVWGIRRFVRPPALSMIVALVPVVVVVATVVWPYLRPATSVDEAFPTVIAAPETPSDTAPVDELAPTTTVSPNSAPTDTLGVTEPGEVINETDPSSSESIADTSEKDGATATTTVPAADGEPDPASASTTTPASTTTASTTTSTTTAPTTVPTGPVLLRSAGFQGLTGHNGSGNAALYRLADNSILLRFESVNIGPGRRCTYT